MAEGLLLQSRTERDGPGERWVTIDGRHVLIREPQGKKSEQESLTRITVLGSKVIAIYDLRPSPDDKSKSETAIRAAAKLLNENADRLATDEKRAIGEISSVFVTGSAKAYLGATGRGAVTLSKDYIEDPQVSPAWIASLLGHEGQHYLNKGKYSAENRWRDEQSASKTQLTIGGKVGFSVNERDTLTEWMDDRNRAAMQEHMERGYTY